MQGPLEIIILYGSVTVFDAEQACMETIPVTTFGPAEGTAIVAAGVL